MNQPSHYQTVFFRELVRQRIDLHVYYATGLPADRRGLGWSEPAQEAYPQKVLNSKSEALCLAWRHRNAVHLVNGMWSVPVFFLISSALLFMGSDLYFHSEPPQSVRFKLLKRAWVRMAFYRARGLFAIGRRAADFYGQMGVPSDRIFPFMYFNRAPAIRPRPVGVGFTIIYVGQLIARKRVLDLIHAVAKMSRAVSNTRLLIVGSGPQRVELEEAVCALGLRTITEFRGALPPDDVHIAICNADVLVLPSVFDGWGVVVNEALQMGVPAICSDGCGAAELIEDHPKWGCVYPVGDISQLAAALHEVALNREKFTPDIRDVEKTIGPEAMTTQFLRTVFAS